MRECHHTGFSVAPGATVYTDGLKSFSGLREAGFKHVPRNQPLRIELRKGAKSAVPLAHRAIGNLQQWLIGTYHGDRHLSRCEPRSAPGLSGRICLSPQPPEATD